MRPFHLPEELITMILFEIRPPIREYGAWRDWREDRVNYDYLTRLAGVNRLWRQASLAVLFHTLHIRQGETERMRSDHIFELSAHPERAIHVKHIRATIPPSACVHPQPYILLACLENLKRTFEVPDLA